MNKNLLKHSFLVLILSLFAVQFTFAGPPFFTDDPQTVDFKHWEYYISSVNTFQANGSTGTLPHFEVNYGLVPNVQVHLLVPVNYSSSKTEGFTMGYANTEFGVKYRFVQETDNIPQIGTFPILQIPTLKNTTFGNGQLQLFIPLWAQKTWGKLTMYGGAGYWINPGVDNKNWIFTGLETQYDISPLITLGSEIYYHTADAINSKSVGGFNVGGSVNLSVKTHIIFSTGHSLLNENYTSTYIGILWTI